MNAYKMTVIAEVCKGIALELEAHVRAGGTM